MSCENFYSAIHEILHLKFLDKTVAIQLRGTESSNGIGRVEVFYNGQWGTICRDGWDMNNTDVVCRELGFEYSIKTLQRGRYRKGTGPIWLSEVSCTGKEHYFGSCSLGGWGNNSCRHNDDVGVECSSTGNLGDLFFMSILVSISCMAKKTITAALNNIFIQKSLVYYTMQLKRAY